MQKESVEYMLNKRFQNKKSSQMILLFMNDI